MKDGGKAVAVSRLRYAEGCTGASDRSQICCTVAKMELGTRRASCAEADRIIVGPSWITRIKLPLSCEACSSAVCSSPQACSTTPPWRGAGQTSGRRSWCGGSGRCAGGTPEGSCTTRSWRCLRYLIHCDVGLQGCWIGPTDVDLIVQLGGHQLANHRYGGSHKPGLVPERGCDERSATHPRHHLISWSRQSFHGFECLPLILASGLSDSTPTDRATTAAEKLMRELFDSFDVNGNGSLHHHEVRRPVSMLGRLDLARIQVIAARAAPALRSRVPSTGESTLGSTPRFASERGYTSILELGVVRFHLFTVWSCHSGPVIGVCCDRVSALVCRWLRMESITCCAEAVEEFIIFESCWPTLE